MTDTEISAVEQLAVSPTERLVLALAAEHAARASTIRHLTLEDVDLPSRRITIAGHNQRLGELSRRGAGMANQLPRDWRTHRCPGIPK